MSYFVRKINKGKWKSDSAEPIIKADALTSCLRTSSNTLSFWRIEELSNIEDAKLAIAASNSNLDPFDIIVFTNDEIEELGAPIVEKAGKTACSDLVDSHRDLSNLDSSHLIKLSHAVLKKVQSDDVERVTFAKLKSMLISAAAQDRLNIGQLTDAVKLKIGIPIEPKPACTCDSHTT